MSASTSAVPSPHPYLDAAWPIIQTISQEEAVLMAGGLAAGIIITIFALFITGPKQTRNLAFSGTVVWMVLCTFIHSWIELHFVFFRHDSRIARAMDLYAAADFRYGRPLESGTAAMETITALIDGPFCLFIAYAIVHQKAWRHPLQLVLSVCQMYGLVWFILHGVFHHEAIASSDPFLYWVIFVGMNAPWGLIPPVLAFQSFKAITKAFSAQQTVQNGKKKQ